MEENRCFYKITLNMPKSASYMVKMASTSTRKSSKYVLEYKL